MEKKLQDYIHFYIGQPCVNSWFAETHDMYDNGWILAGVDKISTKPYKLENSDDFSWSQEVKPLLRPLSAVTDEEAQEAAEILGGASHISKEGQIRQFKELIERIYNMQTNIPGMRWIRLTVFLLSRGFDLFDLIESGLALDKIKRKEGKV